MILSLIALCIIVYFSIFYKPSFLKNHFISSLFDLFFYFDPGQMSSLICNGRALSKKKIIARAGHFPSNYGLSEILIIIFLISSMNNPGRRQTLRLQDSDRDRQGHRKGNSHARRHPMRKLLPVRSFYTF